jgi:5-methylcytosine-specific restriction endonuclease McrA
MKEEQLQYYREYYKNNKSKYNKRNEKYQCSICGSIFSFRTKSNHIRSERHKAGKESFMPADNIPILNMMLYEYNFYKNREQNVKE